MQIVTAEYDKIFLWYSTSYVCSMIFATSLACVAWRFCRAGRTSGEAAKFARKAARKIKTLRPNLLAVSLPSPTFITYLAGPTKTAMIRRLRPREARKQKSHKYHRRCYIPGYNPPKSCVVIEVTLVRSNN